MNKMIVCGFLLIGLMLVFSACGGAVVEPAAEEPAPPGPAEEEPAPEEEPPEEAAPAEELMVYDISAPVVILVADNFHIDSGEESQDLPYPETAGNCLVTPDGFGNYGGMDFGNYGGMDFGVGPGAPLYHGHIVLGEVASQIEADGGWILASTFNGDTLNFNFDWLAGVEVWQTDREQYIIMVAFDTFNFNTAVLAPNLFDTINFFSNETQMEIGGYSIEPVRRFVINMSFGIVPCDPNELVDPDVYAERIAERGGIDDLNGLIASFVRRTGASEALAEKIVTTTMIPGMVDLNITSAYPDFYEDPTQIEFLINDPLKDMLDTLFRYREDTTIISVAAAGNFGSGYPYPFAPAMWDNVVSISGQSADGRLADYSNPGEVMVSGVVTRDPNIPEATSYAAPKFSYRAAMYLLNGGGQFCDPAGTSISPPMGYAGDQGSWDNLTLDDAANNYCHEFPQ